MTIRLTDSRPARLPLTGADCFLRAFDAEIGRWNGASHVSGLVLRLGPGFDVEIFRKLLDDVAREQPILGAPIRRRFGLGLPEYRLDPGRDGPPPVSVHDVDAPRAAGAPLPAIFSRRLNERRSLRRGELIRFDVVRYAGGAGGTELAMTWMHLLLDGAGSERFVQWLDEVHRGAVGASDLPDPDELRGDAPSSRSLAERGDAARRWKAWVDGFAEPPLRSLAGPRRRVPQDLRFDVLHLNRDETERAVAQAGRRAGFLTPMLFYLAAAIRAHHAVFEARGVDPGAYLVPLPVNLRPRGREGAIFRTHVSLIWFHVDPAVVGDFDALIDELKAQRRAAIKAGHVENGVAAMEFVRSAPARLYARMARSGTKGELCSFFFAYTGEFLPGIERFLGAEIHDGFHVAPVPPSPGSCMAMSIHRGRLNLTHVFQRSVVADDERRRMRDSLRRDLLSEAGR